MVAIVTWCEGVGEQVEQGSIRREERSVEAKGPESVTVATLRRQSGNMAKERAVSGEVEVEVKKEKTDPADVSVVHFNAEGEHSREWIDVLWKNIISEMKSHNHMIAGVLRSCSIIDFDRAKMRVQAASAFHKDKLSDAKTSTLLHEVATKLVGNPVEITIELKA
jgi:hypothetical protein